MKEIIINKDNIKDEDVTDKRVINNYIFINDNKILLKYHHNSYYFIHDDDYNNLNYKPLLVKKIYDEDYPLLGDKCLTLKYYYLINEDILIDNTVWIDKDKGKEVIEKEKYNNPRVQDIEDELIEVLNILL